MASRIDPQILQAGAQDETGQNAKMSNFVGAMAIGDVVKSTFGPYGYDKILLPVGSEAARQDDATITNDGATILHKIWIDNPAAQILVDVAKTQDKTVGDGTTAVVLLTSELLKEAEQLINSKIHAQIVAEGYHIAMGIAQEVLDTAAFEIGDDNFKNTLVKLAKTTLQSKVVSHNVDKFANICVDAVLGLDGDIDLDLIHIIKQAGGTMHDSYIADGIILEKEVLPSVKLPQTDCKIMLADAGMDADKIKIFGARVRVDSLDQVSLIEKAEKYKMEQKVNRICSHDINVFVNRQLIYDYPVECFIKKGVTPIEHADFDGINRLSLVLDADVAAVFDEPGSIKLGRCAKIDKLRIGEGSFIHFTGCPKTGATTIVLRGPSKHVLDETERSIHDALAVLSQTIRNRKFVYGGGAIELQMAEKVESASQLRGGKVSLAIEAFSRALRITPTILLENSGHDAPDVVTQLRALHHCHRTTMGADLDGGAPCDMRERGIVESYWSKMHQLRNSVEAATTIIRCDEVIRCAPRQRQGV